MSTLSDDQETAAQADAAPCAVIVLAQVGLESYKRIARWYMAAGGGEPRLIDEPGCDPALARVLLARLVKHLRSADKDSQPEGRS